MKLTKTLTIGIEATAIGIRGSERHGVFRYLQQLLLGFRSLGAIHRFQLFFNAFSVDKNVAVPAFMNELGWDQLEAKISRFPARLRERLNLPLDRFTGPLDLFHAPSHMLPRNCSVPKIVTIHDLAFFRMTEAVKKLRGDWVAAIRSRSSNPAADIASYRQRCNFFLGLQRGVPETLKRADIIIAVSHATAQDLMDITGIESSRIRVVPNGMTPGFSRIQDKGTINKATDDLGIKGPYILYVGVLDPNKDISTLLAAYAGTSDDFRHNHQLVIAGPLNWYRSILEEEAYRLGIGDRMLFTGFVPDQLLPAVYSGASVFVSPSPLEGFGFPVLEAMACGTPVIIVNAGSLPEVAGEAALSVQPGNPGAMSAAIERLAGDQEFAASLVSAGLTRCKEFSWERAARLTMDVYSEAAG